MNKGLILVFFTALISGISIFINKLGVSFANPYVFVFLKNLAVALVFCGLCLAIKERAELKKMAKKQWLILVLIGLVGGSIPFLLFFKGLAITSAAQGSFIQKTMFIFAAVLAALFLKEKITKNFLIGSLLLLVGNILLLKNLNLTFGKGDILILIATFFWAVENIISKKILRELPGNIVAGGRMFFGAIFISLFLLITGQAGSITSLNWSQIIWVGVTSVLLFGYTFTWYNGLKHIPVSLAASVLLLGSPVTTMLTAISGGKITVRDLNSGIMIIGGLILMLYFDRIWGKVKSFKDYVRT